MKKIFLSHAFLDREIANRIIDKLLVPIFDIDKKKDVFYTSRRSTGIRSNSNWRNNIKENLTESKIFIPLVTVNFKNSEMCISELGAAWALNKDIFPLLIPPINYDNFGVVISELQADNLMRREDITMFIESLSADLDKLYEIKQIDSDIDSNVTKFLKSLRDYRKRNPDLFNLSITLEEEAQSVPKKKQVTENKGSKNSNQTTNGEPTAKEIKGIKDQSKIEWPEDYSMQEYFINEQTESLLKVRKLQKKYKDDPKILRIIERAITEWPVDYTMQEHTINDQLDSLGRI